LRARHWLYALLGVVLLNAAVTFHNVWPTLGVHWPGELSVEVAVLLVALALWHGAVGAVPRVLKAVLCVLVVLFTLGRYADVTAPALYGRAVNLYWDGPQLAGVAAMLVRVATVWQVAGICAGVITVLAVLYLLARWSLEWIDAVLRVHRGARIGTAAVGAVLVGCFLLQQAGWMARVPRFSIPVSASYAWQVERLVDALTGRAARGLPPSPALHSSFARLAGADVLLVFMESYGSCTYDRPEFVRALAPARARLAAALRDTGRAAVSAFLTSPTFGGGSVLAHLSTLAGVEVRDQDRYALLMTQQRPTLVSVFAAAGYRTVAVMPGLQKPWPEGAFYGFDTIYGADALGYRGPAFGWWRIPDQYSLAALDARELQRQPRRPLFVFFPTVSTHMPFAPTPPLQPDWQRVLSPRPFDAGPLAQALAQRPVWTDLGPAYTRSVAYFLDTLSSYLRMRPAERFVLIVLGDHQPAASVSGVGVSWDVPVHVIASDPQILRSLQRVGFRPGLTPLHPAVGRMSELGPWLLAAFGGPASAPVPVPLPVSGGAPATITAR